MLTEKRIRDAKPGPRAEILWDDAIKGLGVKIQPGGTKSYVLSYRVEGKKRMATLGRVGEIPLKAARERAGTELIAIRDGEADPLERRRARMEAPTVGDGVARFFEEYAPRRMNDGRLSERTLRDYRQQWGRVVKAAPAFTGKKIAAVTRHDIEKAVANRAPIQRNRTIAFLSRLFNLFEAWEYRPQHSNPCRHIEKAREQPRDRTLAPSELAALADALAVEAEARPAAVAAIRVAAVTGLRIGEVLRIRWQDIDFETGRLTMPETKTGRRTHDLPAAALAILADQPRINAWAFTNGRNAPAGYQRTRDAFAESAKRAGLSDVRLHDLRRTVMTRAAMAGVGTHVLRDLLGHKTAAMADRYIRAVGNPVREAREQIGAEMAAAMAGTGGKVVPLRSHRG